MKCVSCSSTADTSNEALFDKWSIGHVLTGMMTSAFIFIIPWWKALWISFSFSIVWELFENTDVGIFVVSKLCCTPKYTGDHLANSIADVFCNTLGFVILFTIYYTTQS